MPLFGERRKEYQRLYVAKRRAAYFKDRHCVKCGSKERLELDHIDPSTKISHNIWSWSEIRRSEELAKCQVLCYDCHKLKTVEDCRLMFIKPFSERKHGTNKTYSQFKCRCELCLQWKIDYRAKQRLVGKY